MRMTQPPSTTTRRIRRPSFVAAFGLCLLLATGSRLHAHADHHDTTLATATTTLSTPPAAKNEGYATGVVIKPLLKTRTDNAGHPLVYPATGPAESHGLIVEIPAGQETGWHRHPVPCLAYVLEGEIRVHLRNGDVKVIQAGQAIAEFVDLDHNGVNPGPGPARLVFFVIGTADQPFTVKTPAQTREE